MCTLYGLTTCRGDLCSEVANDAKDVVVQGTCIVLICTFPGWAMKAQNTEINGHFHHVSVLTQVSDTNFKNMYQS